jgi:hypothetical protein
MVSYGLSIEMCNILIISTSTPSLSERVPDAFKLGGGASIAAIFFLLRPAKKLPKKPPSPSFMTSRTGLAARSGLAKGRGLPVFGSTCTGFDGECFSLTIAIACANQ